MSLPPRFLSVPLAHRALHGAGTPENSRAAIRAAIGLGYGIEIDLQLSADEEAMVFHDYALDRLTGARGPVRARSAAELARIALAGGDGETIPTFAQVLKIVAGQVPVLVEIKDQDGAMGPDVGPLERAAARALAGYAGDVAVMSFNPHSVAAFAEQAPDVARGLTTSAYDPGEWPLPRETCDRLRAIPDAEPLGAWFISHEAADLARPRVAELKAQGLAVLCWTIRSPEEERAARRVADNITFEGYSAAHAA
jgi:glycerophosphoryl diester phosphodiesterase